MKKIILFLLAILYVGICKAQLSAADCKYVLEIFCRNYYGSCFEGKTYVPNTIIITSVGIDQNSGGTFVSGLHSYQGQYIPFRGRKTHTNVQFNAVIVRQQSVTMWFSTNGMNRTCSTERVDGRPGRDSLPTNRISLFYIGIK